MQSHPINAKEVKGVLRRWLDETDVKCACALGIKNYTKDHVLENPRVYVSSGKISHEPTDKVETNMASAAFFTKTEYALKGTSGCICYDISNTEFMVTVLWRIPFSETLAENHFNFRVFKRGECNKALYDELEKDYKMANGELVREENGYRLCGCMGRESKAIFIIDCYEAGHMGALSVADPVKNAELEGVMRTWLQDCPVSVACAIGVNNFAGHQLKDPKVFIQFGRSCIDPPRTTNPHFAAPSLYCKREYSITGTSGVITYDIKETELMLTVFWLVPITEYLCDNTFLAFVTKKENCDSGYYKKLFKEARPAKEGTLVREDQGFQVTSKMETGAHCCLLVEVRAKTKAWW